MLGKVEGTAQNLAGKDDIADEQGNEDQQEIPYQLSSEVLPLALHTRENIEASATTDSSASIQLGTSVQDTERRLDCLVDYLHLRLWEIIKNTIRTRIQV